MTTNNTEHRVESDGTGEAETAPAADESAGNPASDTERSGQDDGEPALDAAARAELLEEENRRLRAEYARSRKSEYRRVAYALAAIGLVGVVGGLLFADGREVLFAFGFTGLFGAVLTLYLSPSQVVAADIGERVYAAMAANDAALATQLGIGGDHVYIPGEGKPAHLFVPQDAGSDPPDPGEGPVVVAEEHRGLLLETTGAYLFEEFERALSGDLATEPGPLATQLADAAVEQFELATSIDAGIDAADGRATFRLSGSAFGDVDRFDHPLASFLGSGFAAGLDRPVSLEVDSGGEYADWLVTCRWSVED